jgi:hypothetical protein
VEDITPVVLYSSVEDIDHVTISRHFSRREKFVLKMAAFVKEPQPIFIFVQRKNNMFSLKK